MYLQDPTSARRNILRFALAAWALLLCIGLSARLASADAAPKSASSPADQGKMAAPVSSCSIGGSVVPSPNTAPNPNNLKDVEVISANDIWAVGHYGQGYPSSRTLTMHWDGVSWSVIPSPDPGAYNSAYNMLLGVAAVTSNDVWAVGSYCSIPHGPCGSLILRWNGTQWSQIPNPGSIGLAGIEVISANDIWAVGGSNRTITMHWDGTQWTRVPSPNPYGGNAGVETNILVDVEEVAPGEVWAAGYSSFLDPEWNCGSDGMLLRWTGTQWDYIFEPGCSPYSYSTLHAISATSPNDVWVVGSSWPEAVARHWNGSAWETYPIACPSGSRPCPLVDVKAISPDDVWAVGTTSNWQSYSAHWDGTQWSVVSTPPGAYLYALDISPTNDMWAVGVAGNVASSNTRNLTLRWGGTQWSEVASPNVASGYNTLRGVEVIAPNDIWAVGYSMFPSGGARTLIEHWDGNQWSVVPSPNEPNVSVSELYAISAASPNDIWAVGQYQAIEMGATVYKPMSLHWDGARWHQVPVATTNQGCSNPLSGVKAISANDVWAVGQNYCSNPSIVNTSPLHWDGQQWTLDQSLQWTPSDRAKLLSIDGVSSNDLWAVGEYTYGNTNLYETFIVHWNGQRWSRVPSPNVGTDNNRLKGVTAVAANDVWAVGYYGPPGLGHALALRWDGTEWSVIPTPDMGESSYFLGAASGAADDVWAVGNYISGGVPRTLVERWDGAQWGVVSSPNVTQGSNYLWGAAALPGSDMHAVGDHALGIAQHTLIERFSPATFTPFSDVPEGSTFYQYVRCLTCRGIISGYADGTFRPNNNVTRGQLSKIVSNSAGFAEDPGPQIFEDVPPGSTFYEWVQRLASRGHIGGYPCGGAGEPCLSGKPYFRPNANATRAQISKIVSNARGYNEPPGAQIFEDVPPTHPFYEWIQRLAQHGAMGGYECGGAGEPCGVGSRPYFRPNNNATRGQTSKIVSNTFFPECTP